MAKKPRYSRAEMVAKELAAQQNTPDLQVVSNFREVCGVISQQAELAKEIVSPELNLHVLASHNEDPVLQDLYDRIHKKCGLQGSVQIFERKHLGGHFAGGPVGVPMRTADENGEVGIDYYIGVYVPGPADRRFGSAREIQLVLNAELNEMFALAKINHQRLNFQDGILVVTKELASLWKSSGMWEEHGVRWEHEAGIEVSNVVEMATHQESQDLADELEISHQEMATTYMHDVYLPTLMNALGIMGDNRMVPNQLLPGGRPSDILTFINGQFLMVNVGVLVSTAHNERLKAAIYHRDGYYCQFPYRSGQLLSSQRFTVNDLVKLEEDISLFRQPEDPNHDMVGTDFADLEEEANLSRFRCGLNLWSYYTDIHPQKKRLEIGGTYANLHHIVPRGAAYRALLSAFLLDEKMKEQGVDINLREWSVRDLALLLRGASIPYLISDQSMYLYEDQKKVIETLEENAFLFDSVVNSPYNLIMLCSHHHNDVVHPDMVTGRQVLALLHAINTRNLVLKASHEGEFERLSDELTEMIMAGKLKPAPEMDYADVMAAIKTGRYLVSAMGVPYWSIPTADYMLDWARVATDAVNRRERQDVIDSYLSGGVGLTRSQTFSAIQALQQEQGNTLIPKINRRDDRLRGYQDWENSGRVVKK